MTNTLNFHPPNTPPASQHTRMLYRHQSFLCTEPHPFLLFPHASPNLSRDYHTAQTSPHILPVTTFLSPPFFTLLFSFSLFYFFPPNKRALLSPRRAETKQLSPPPILSFCGPQHRTIFVLMEIHQIIPPTALRFMNIRHLIQLSCTSPSTSALQVDATRKDFAMWRWRAWVGSARDVGCDDGIMLVGAENCNTMVACWLVV